jgi:hypothetical protein
LKIALLVLPIFLQAAPVGNPSVPQMICEGFVIPAHSLGAVRIGYEGDFVNNARMNQREEGSGHIDDYQQDTNSGSVTLNFIHRLDLYGVFGSSRTCAAWRFITTNAKTNRVDMATDSRFLWATGVRAILYEWGNATLGAGGRYSQTEAQLSWMTLNGVPVPTEGSHLKWQQWQINLLISYKIDIFIPYLGINYLQGRTEVGPFLVPVSQSGGTSMHMGNRSSTGIVIGCSLTTGKDFMLNIEARLIDEEAYDVSGDFKF